MASSHEQMTLNEVRSKYGKWINKAAAETGMDRELIASLISHESEGNQRAIGSSGEWGLTQLMPNTAEHVAKKYGVSYNSPQDLKKKLLDLPGLNIVLGAKYYKEQLDKAGGNATLAYSLYNGGPGYAGIVDSNSANPAWRKAVFERIKAGDFSGSDQYSTNVMRFSKYLEASGLGSSYNSMTAKPKMRELTGPLGSQMDPSMKSPFAPTSVDPKIVPNFQQAMNRYGAENPNLNTGGVATPRDIPQPGRPSTIAPDPRYQPKNTGRLEAGDEENPIVSAYRGLVSQGSMGYYDPLQGEARGTGIPARVGESLGRGAAVGAQFTPLGAATRAAGIGGLASSAAAMGAYGAAYNPNEGVPSGAGASGLKEQIMARGIRGAKDAAIGGAMGAVHFIPGVGRLANTLAGGIGTDIALLSGASAAERAARGEDINMKDILIDTVPFAIGMRGGRVAGEGAMGPSEASIAKSRAEGVRKGGRARVAEDMANAQRLLGPGAIEMGPVRAPRPGDVMADRHLGRVANEPQAKGTPTRYRSEYAGRNEYPVAISPQTAIGKRVFNKPYEPAAERGPIELPVPADQGYVATSPQTSTTKTWRKPGSRVEETSRIREDLRSGKITPEKAAQDLRVGDPWRAMEHEAALAGIEGRADLEVMRAMDRNVKEQARLYEENRSRRTGDMTTDMLGGQQMYDWMSGLASKARTAMSESAKSRSMAKEQRIQGLTKKFLSDPAFIMEGLPNADRFLAAAGTTARSGSAWKPVKGERATEPMVDYLNDKITAEQMMERMKADPEMFNLAADAVAQAEAAARVSKLSGKAKKGELSPEEMAAYNRDVEVAKDLGTRGDEVLDTFSLDRRRAARRAGGGAFDSPLSRSFMRVGEISEVVREKLSADLIARNVRAAAQVGFDLGNKNDNQALGRALRAADPQQMADALKYADNPASVEAMLPKVRKNLQLEHEIRNTPRELFSSKEGEDGSVSFPEVGYRENYFPETKKPSGNPLARAWEATAPAGESTPTSGTPRVWSPREMARKGTLSESEINFDANKVLADYSRDTARVLSNSIALNAGENVVKAMRDVVGAPKTAEGLSAVNQQAYNGKHLDLSTNRLKQSRGGTAALFGMRAYKRAWNLAKYSFRIPMAVMTQGISTGMLWSHGEITPDMMMRATKKLFDPVEGDRWNHSYTQWAKSRRSGRMFREGGHEADALGSGGLRNSRVRSAAEKAEMAAGILNNAVEDLTGRFAFNLAGEIAKKSGLPPEQALQFQSDVAGLTQSFYDKVNRAPIASDPVLNIAFPAQGFAVEGVNNIRSAVRGETGPGRRVNSKVVRASRVAQTVAATFLFNMMRTYFTAYKGDKKDPSLLTDLEFLRDNALATGGAFSPYAGSLTPWSISKGRVMPAKSFANLIRGVQRIKGTNTKDPDFKRGAATIANELAIFGADIYTVSEALVKYNEGIITEEDLPLALIFGWGSTPSGKEFLRNARGNAGEFKLPEGRPKAAKPKMASRRRVVRR